MRKLLIAALVPMSAFCATNTFADATSGELFGYRLGATYTENDVKSHDDARLVLIATQNPVKPDSIDTVYVLATPISRSIGKIAGESWFASGEDAIVEYERFRTYLRSKYDDWDSEERSDVHYQVTHFRHADYSLSVQVSGPHRDNATSVPTRPFQLVIALAYQPATAPAVVFEQKANQEIKQAVTDKLAQEEMPGL